MHFIALIVAVCVALAGASCPYSSGGIAAPPCPKNYLFSCQPNLVPVPCAQEAASYGSAGAYTEHIPFYVGYPNHQQLEQYQERIARAALIDGLRGLTQGIQDQQY
ncbi:hypothetical protein KR074_004237 [Drosophila pseudoananassae]|nr:hypothetical protein KR074_004237 [Drosophila pseudoananassae]